MLKKTIIIFILLFGVFILSSKSVDATTGSGLKITGHIYTEENILIQYENVNNIITYTPGRYITGSFYIEYTIGQIEYSQLNVAWIIYSGSELYAFGTTNVPNPWSYFNGYSPDYLFLAFDQYYTIEFSGIHCSERYYSFNPSLYEFHSFLNYSYDNFISNHPRYYNDTRLIHGNNTTTTNVNCDYNYFFTHLDENFGNNDYCSCGFIAIATLLAYYDFFYNDYFVDDSASYSNEYFIITEESNSLSTSSFDHSPGCSDALQYYLTDVIAINGLHIQFPCFNNHLIYSSSESMQLDVIEKYLQTDVSNISSNNYSINYLSDEEEIKAELDLGRPVIMGVTSYEYQSVYDFGENDTLQIATFQGHSLIAYGYKELANGETLYRCHMGWHCLYNSYEYTDVLLKPIDNLARGVSIIYTGNTNNCNDNVYLYNHTNINDNACFGICHKHSGYDYYLDKVILNSSYDNYYCPTCDALVMQLPHTHEKSYTYHNLYNHYVTCPCGYSGYESHVEGIGPLPNGYYKCKYCHGFMDGGSIHNKINPPYDPRCHE